MDLIDKKIEARKNSYAYEEEEQKAEDASQDGSQAQG